MNHTDNLKQNLTILLCSVHSYKLYRNCLLMIFNYIDLELLSTHKILFDYLKSSSYKCYNFLVKRCLFQNLPHYNIHSHFLKVILCYAPSFVNWRITTLKLSKTRKVISQQESSYFSLVFGRNYIFSPHWAVRGWMGDGSKGPSAENHFLCISGSTRGFLRILCLSN